MKTKDERLESLSDQTNRSYGQTEFLFNLLGGDYGKLEELENKIKTKFVSYCPSTMEEVNKLMK